LHTFNFLILYSLIFPVTIIAPSYLIPSSLPFSPFGEKGKIRRGEKGEWVNKSDK